MLARPQYPIGGIADPSASKHDGRTRASDSALHHLYAVPQPIIHDVPLQVGEGVGRRLVSNASRALKGMARSYGERSDVSPDVENSRGIESVAFEAIVISRKHLDDRPEWTFPTWTRYRNSVSR
jgi:hypothetical protein